MACLVFLCLLPRCFLSQNSSSRIGHFFGQTGGGLRPAHPVPAMHARDDAGHEVTKAVPGIVILVRSPNRGLGVSARHCRDWNHRPWALNDHFRIGSNTKTMTGTVILQLAQEGKLALTDP